LYALRDVTGTVKSMPLIASSIMSKKIAAGAQSIVLDVKVGNGAFMETLQEGRDLARLLVDIAHLAGRKAIALLSDMNQPLGCAVGNAVEVREAIDTLHGQGPRDFREHCLVLASYLIYLGGKATNVDAGKKLAQQALDSGGGWEYFRRLVQAQSGDVSVVDYPERLPQARYVEVIPAPRAGYLQQVHALMIGEAAMRLGAGRLKKSDSIDHAVGVVVHHKVGDKIEAGQPLFTLYANDMVKLAEACIDIMSAHQWSDEPVQPLPLFYGVVE
jgi:pyrimidine-nucleoside phosphorylase